MLGFGAIGELALGEGLPFSFVLIATDHDEILVHGAIEFGVNLNDPSLLSRSPRRIAVERDDRTVIVVAGE